MTSGSRRQTALLGAICLVFVLLATANSGGYRYGIGDQAFYEPVTQLRLHPNLFPRDRALLESQARLTIVDEVLAGASRVTGLELPSLFLALYVLSLVTLCLGGSLLARVLGFSPWATTVFLAALTLRHRIAKTGVNTLEGYMHPRQLAFGVGLVALAFAMKQRWRYALVLWFVAAAIHPTTAVWFAAFVVGGIALESVVAAGAFRLVFMSLAGLGIADAVGYHVLPMLPLPGHLFMDRGWTAVFAEKDYVFASTWPLWAWAFNLAYLPLIWMIYTRRVAAQVAVPHEARLVAGSLALFVIFVASLTFSEARLALAVQLQVSRVFWWMDVLVAAYAAWWVTSDPVVARVAGQWAPRMAVGLALALPIGRGVYTVGEGGADRRLFRVNLPDNDWSRAMQWLKTQPVDWEVLAHPGHAWMYGTSVRVAASRDVVLESVKDSSISLYGRDVAMRVAERTQALARFTDMTADEARAIGARYGATVLVTESSQKFALPQLYRNGGFTVYDLR